MTEREHWSVTAPPGGWGRPWPLAVEVSQVLPEYSWTLVGGLMVQVHAARAGIGHRPTSDVDIVLHIETDAITYKLADGLLEKQGFELRIPNDPDGSAHRYVRGDDVIDMMVSDHLKHPQRIRRFDVYRVPGSTGALQRTVNVTTVVGGQEVRFSLPSVLAALGLKGAAYISDTRNPGRHLSDAAVLACCLGDPEDEVAMAQGSDRRRIQALWRELRSPEHEGWRGIADIGRREEGYDALHDLVELLLGRNGVD